ncbi:MAG: hypothetical protein Q8K20_07550 [Gemmobacter sp.]|nr:hypothetical protein [Gemmobacter sp.]
MDDRLQRLVELSALIRDLKLAELSVHARSCAQIRDRLAGLTAPLPKESDLPAAALDAAALRHERWAAPRRMALNEQLATENARRLVAETTARAAFGRAQVLQKLRDSRR